ncbi:hypothetical protein MESS2_p140018 [Mesorhizobium metallidurans STM 2683]|uniref:Uncharacterized protein n=1 Tax=Mesorhizobium metallidurans STM 2683 TaxID=1297569 RepID=M5EWP6_9HYPH|nr:hypothetical protein MESS2_p140018 [Mesorhizobium metallidurans STM 2683]
MGAYGVITSVVMGGGLTVLTMAVIVWAIGKSGHSWSAP